MHLQLNTDHHLRGSEALAQRLKLECESALGRFAPRVTRVEMHLNDVNGERAGVDKRCQLEARVAGRAPLSVQHVAPSVQLAVDGALTRLVRALDHALGKRDAGSKGAGRGRGAAAPDDPAALADDADAGGT